MIRRFGVLLVFAAIFSTGCATQQTAVADNSTQKNRAPCVSAIPYVEAGDQVVVVQTGTVPLYMQLTEKSCKRVYKQGF